MDANGARQPQLTRRKGEDEITAQLRFFTDLCAVASFDPPDQNVRAQAAEVFRAAYVDYPIPRASTKVGSRLPLLDAMDQCRLTQLLATWAVVRQKPIAQVRSLIQLLVKNIHFSSWPVHRILDDRITEAQRPPPPTVNDWAVGGRAKRTAPKTEEFTFDPTEFPDDEVAQLKALCEAQHYRPARTRAPTGDEWKVIAGLLNGKIIARKLPQFLQLCCDWKLMLTLHNTIEATVEGELFAGLPLATKIYPGNQHTRRIVGEIELGAARNATPDARLHEMLAQVKSIAYNVRCHSLHFHFANASVAAKFEGLRVPFRNVSIDLRAPFGDGGTAARMQGVEMARGVPDRYQRFYTIRLLNTNRYTNTAGILCFLDEVANGQVKAAYPLDSYGQHSTWSLAWEVVFSSMICPTKLQDVFLLKWGEVAVIIQHAGLNRSPPCLACGKPGHQIKECSSADAGAQSKHVLVVAHAATASYNARIQPWESLQQAHSDIHAAQVAPEQDDSTSSTESHVDRVQPTTTEQQPTSTTVDKAATGIHESQPSRHDQPDAGAATDSRSSGKSRSPKPSNGGASTRRQQPMPSTQFRGKGGHDVAKVQRPPLSHTPIGASEATAIRFSSSDDSDNVLEDDGDSKMAEAEGASAAEHVDPITTDNPFAALSESLDDEEGADRELEANLGSTQDGSTTTLSKTAVAPSPATSDSQESSDTPRSVRKHRRTAFTEDEALALATRRRKVLDLRTDLLDQIRHVVSPAWTPAAMLQHLRVNKEKILNAASGKEVFQRMGGRVGSTPANGNCQYYSIVECLANLPAPAILPATLVSATTLLKERIAAVTLLDLDQEFLECEGTLPIDVITRAPSELPAAEKKARMAAHYTALAASSTELDVTLDGSLWGTLDTLRMSAKLLGRRIFVLAESATGVGHYRIAPATHKQDDTLFFTAGIHTGSRADWLSSIERELTRTKQAPLVLHLTGVHYQAVLFTLTDKGKQLTRTRLQTRLPDFFRGVAMIDEIVDESDATPIELADLADCSTQELLEAMQGPRLGHAEKQELWTILQTSPTRRSELLTINTSSTLAVPADLAQRVRERGRVTIDIVEDFARRSGTTKPVAARHAQAYLAALTPEEAADETMSSKTDNDSEYKPSQPTPSATDKKRRSVKATGRKAPRRASYSKNLRILQVSSRRAGLSTSRMV